MTSIAPRECLGAGRPRRPVPARRIGGAFLWVMAGVVLSAGPALMGCDDAPMSPIEEIRGVLTTAENLKKVDPDVLDWYEEHPGETAILRIKLAVDYEALDLERETSLHSAERRALVAQGAEIQQAAHDRGEQLSDAEMEELLRLHREKIRLQLLVEADIREIRKRNDRRRVEAYDAVWASVLAELQQIDDIEIHESPYPEPQLRPIVTASASALTSIAAITGVQAIRLEGVRSPTLEVSRSVIGADNLQDQLGGSGGS